MCCRRRTLPEPFEPSVEPSVEPVPCPLPERVAAEAVAEIFASARQRQKVEGGCSGAELVHRQLPAEFWGLGRGQLEDFAREVGRLVEASELINATLAECRQQKMPYYQDSKFRDPSVGPNMHQVNAGYIRPLTKGEDPCHGIPCLSYALRANPSGLLCELFVSHAWSEGVYELSHTVLSNWPEACGGAYICCFANPQNLAELMSQLIATPQESPFFRVLTCRPKMLMTANGNVPIHSRLWCVYEAHLARRLALSVAVVGRPEHFATAAAARAARAIRSAVAARRRELAISEAADAAAMDMDIIAAGIYFDRFKRWEKRAKRQTEKAIQQMMRALDVRKAQCSRSQDGEAIRREIASCAEEINFMICELIIMDQLKRVPAEPCKLTWYPGQDMLEGLRAMFC